MTLNSNNLFPLADKKPMVKDWCNWNGNINDYKNCNYGLSLNDDDLVVDIDIRNGGSLESFYEWYGEEVEPNVKTQGGGYHIYFKRCAGVTVKKNIPELKGVDFLTEGCYIVVPPSVNYQTLSDEVSTFKNEKLVLLMHDFKKDGRECKIDDYRVLSKHLVKELFEGVDPDIEYFDWVKCGIALYNWDYHLGFEIWDNWSSKGVKYTNGECLAKWETFSKGYTYSLGSVYKMFGKRYIKPLTAQDLDTMSRELVPTDKLEYMRLYVYHVKHMNKFYDSYTCEFYNTESFTIEYTRYMPENDKGRKVKPLDYFTNNLDNSISNVQFDPLENFIYHHDGRKYVNTFRKHKLLKPVSEYSMSELSSVRRVECHLKMLGGDDDNLFIQFIAFIVKYPGKKLPFMLILQGIQGLGKTFIYVMLKRLMYYVKTIDTSLLEHTYNDFMESTLLVVFEELKISGFNRKRIQNQLKPLITNEFISINKKYVSEYNTRNFANMIAFTNESDPISIDEGDRRYFVVSNSLNNIKDIPNTYGCDYNNETDTVVRNTDLYFKELFDTVKKHPHALVKYFQSIDTKEIEGLTRSPMNESKKALIEREKENIDGYIEFHHFIDTNVDHQYINKNLVVFSKFKGEFIHNLPLSKQSNLHLSKILKASGFTRLKYRISCKGHKERIYVHTSLTDKEVDIAVDRLKIAFKGCDEVK